VRYPHGLLPFALMLAVVGVLAHEQDPTGQDGAADPCECDEAPVCRDGICVQVCHHLEGEDSALVNIWFLEAGSFQEPVSDKEATLGTGEDSE